MTALRIAYDNMQETKRANQAREFEENRSNVERETENRRHNLATETETNRSNLAKEAENYRHNFATEQETNRHNVRTEDETERSNKAKERETNRSNLAEESLKMRGQTIDALKTSKAKVGVNVGSKSLGASAGVESTLAANYATSTDSSIAKTKQAAAKAKQSKVQSANNSRKLSPEGQAIIGQTFKSQEDAIRAITSIPSEQRVNIQLRRTGKNSWEAYQNPNVDPITGKIKTKK